jgi:hypothetical protein
MSTATKLRARQAEAGIALLISIFILLLISVVAIALIVSSGTETALAGNYRSSTGVYYAALAGLEEARSRLQPKDPNSFKTTWATFYPAPGNTLPIGTVGYVLNPGPTETAGTLLTTYPDTEYDSEFGAGALAGATVNTTLSIWNKNPLNTLPFPGPLYKWVRINAVSELSMNLDTYPYDTIKDPTPLYFDGTHLNDTNSGTQVFEVTALAVLPNASGQSSQKLVQYLAAAIQLNLSFPAALTLDGNTPQFVAPTSPSYWVQGNDQGSAGSCNPTATAFPAVGYTSGSISNFVQPSNPSGVPVALQSHYTNGVSPNPNIVAVSLPANLQTVGGLNALVQTLEQNADVKFNGNATQANMPASMSAANPMTIVINGNLTINGWHATGYGLLLVTGKFTFDPDASWDGIVLVIGRGWFYSNQGASSSTHIQGALLLAQTMDASGNPLPLASAPIFAPVSGLPSGFDVPYPSATNTYGIYYSSCWIQAAMPNLGYKILSFHEIAQ